MKKAIVLLFVFTAVFCLNPTESNAQAFQNGDINLGAGIGIGSRLVGNGGLPLAFHAEKGFTDAISAGLYLAFASYNYSYWKYTYFIIGARGAYHFAGLIDIPDALDLYAGLMLFYQNVSIKVRQDTFFNASSPGSVSLGAYAGARYYFTDKIAGFAELGTGIAWLQLGATFNLSR
ncbi:hypothetical protein QQ008_19650 [Fulvivirgaceae bacterium BMA10]|uniref:Outer membrane protein beta-barrel domain-containing protein n=1 Tax=Splendidivirga corallicola TaxID=3051826 RepID=A0ABT8KVG2_9BACT|nr:hypothetical protein [Fulvivirgaceae bacterium BMA10]